MADAPALWDDPTDILLLQAALSGDRDLALDSAVRWFEQTAFEDIAFRHHRLIAAVGRRFPNARPLADFRSILRSVGKQMWMRSSKAFQAIAPVVTQLDDMHVPWAFYGNIAWQDQQDGLFKDCDQLDVLVHEAAFAFVAIALWRADWNPPHGTEVYKVAHMLEFTDADERRLTLVKDTKLKRDCALSDADLWSGRRSLDVNLQRFTTLAPKHLLALSQKRPLDDLQWLIDLVQVRAIDPPLYDKVYNAMPRFDRRRKILTMVG